MNYLTRRTTKRREIMSCIGAVYLYVVLFFFFSSRRRHTRFDCDWSSDVCSSDLAVALDEAQRRRLRRIEQRAFGAGADARLAQRAGLFVDRQRAERRALRELYDVLLLAGVLCQVLERKVERGALLGRQVEARRLVHGLRRQQPPELRLELLRLFGLQQLEVHAVIAERLKDRLAKRHLLAQCGGVGVRFLVDDHHHLARAVANRAEQRIEPDRCDMEHLERDGARRQPLAAAHGLPPYALEQRPAALGAMEYEAGVLAAGFAIGAEQRLEPSADLGHRRIGVGHSARRAHRGAAAAAGAQMRLDLHMVAVGADGAGRAHLDAAVAARDARAAVRADALLVGEELRLLELADELRELGRRE